MTHPSDLYYEAIGDNFDKWMSDYDVYRRSLLIRKHLGSKGLGKTCLEMGCGTGKISETILGQVGSLIVSDISAKLASDTAKRLGTQWMEQDVCAINLPDNSFDIVISSECIEHAIDPHKALTEMFRVLKPGGYMIVTTPNKLWYPVIWLSIVTGIRKFQGRENWLFPNQAAKTLRSAGLIDVQLDGCHLFPWQIPLAKKLLPHFDRMGAALYPVMINFCVSGVKPLPHQASKAA